MPADIGNLPQFIGDLLHRHGAALYGFADVNGLTRPHLAQYPRAVSWAMAMDPEIMAGLHSGPTQAYTELYVAMNQRINATAAELAGLIAGHGHQAWAVPASVRSDPEHIRGDFPHKTAATRAGLGWIGRHCQLVTHKLGPWLRLGTVLTDAPLPPGKPVGKSFCGTCTACVEACPAGALTGNPWHPGVPRETILDAQACDIYKKTHFSHFHSGHNCGICTSACIFGRGR